MYKTNAINVVKIIDCMRPSLIHIVRPWMTGDAWILELKDHGYSCINMDMENKAFPERIRDKIQRRLATGSVVTYGIPMNFDVLENIMPDDFVLCWIYPNKQTEYYELIKNGCSDPYRVDTSCMPPGTEIAWKSYLAKPNDSDLRRITKTAHEWQKSQYDLYNRENTRMIVII